jgi:N6-adenosine-specific RNA methylase IME4
MSRGISLKGKAMAKLAINQINVRNRYRKNLGNIESLAASIKELGLLHPIVVRPDGRLIAGERRLAACKRLGWKTVPVTYVDLKEVVRGEFAENAFRKDFLPSEIEAIRRAIEPYERAAAKERQRKHAGTAPGRRKHSGQVSPSDGRSRDRIGAFAGISGRSLAKIQAIVEAAERNPRRFGPLVAQMDRNGRIDGAYRKLQRMKDEEQRLAVKPLRGKFRTLCIDPPWDYTGLSIPERARPTYATMSQKELLALPVGSWAEEEAHLYLWSTNADLPDAFELMERWKFKYITTLTWIKPTFGLGSYFRTTTEHVLFGVRGRLLTRVRNIGTHFTAPKTYHSAKPDLFYQMVEQVSYPPCLDVFARKRRRGWTVWGNGIAAAA